LNNIGDLEIGGAIDGGSGTLSLSTTGDLSISANAGASNNVTLHANGALSATSDISSGRTLTLTADSIDTSRGTLTTNILTGYTNGTADMSGLNSITQLSNFTAGAFSLFNNA